MRVEGLTYDRQVEENRFDRLRGQLALVEPRVPSGCLEDPQRPILRLGVVQAGEPVVRRVRVGPSRQDVDVPVPYPRHLRARTR